MMASDAPSVSMAAGSEAPGALAHALVAELEGTPGPSQSLLMRGARLARMAGVDRMEQWLDCELRGYDPDDPDTDKFMRLSRRWKDEDARVGYFEPLPALESRAAALQERAHHLQQDAAPVFPEHMDERLITIQTALAERAATRAERERARVLAQLGDITAIRSSVFALLHAFADRMAQEASAPEPGPVEAPGGHDADADADADADSAETLPDAPAVEAAVAPDAGELAGLSQEEQESLLEVDREAGLAGNEDLIEALEQAEVWGEDELIGPDSDDDADAEGLPEAMLTDDAALDNLASMLGDNTPEVVNDDIVEDWDAPVDEESDLDSMSADELAAMLESVLEDESPEADSPSGLEGIAETEPEPLEESPQTEEDEGTPLDIAAAFSEEAIEVAAEDSAAETAIADAEEIPPAVESVETAAPEVVDDVPADPDDDPFAPLVSHLMRLRDDMEEADAQEAAAAAVECGEAMRRLVVLLGAPAGAAEPQDALLAAIDARVGDPGAAASLKGRVNGLFAQLIEVEIGGDALVMKRACAEAARLINDLLNA